MKRRLFFLVLMVMSVCSPLAVMAYDFSAVAPSGQTLYYNIINDSTVEITSQNSSSPYYSDGGPVGTLVIPDTVTNPNTGFTYNVKSIGSNAFRNCDNITMVQIANSVTSIGDGVFHNCDRLSDIDFGDSLTSIGSGAFYRCYSLTDIVFPEALRTIGGEAFRNSYITSVTFPTALITVDETAFWECPNFSKAYFMDSLPPYDNNFFTGFYANLYVPCQYISNYQDAFFWNSDISSRIYGMIENWEYSYNFAVNDSTLGSISFTEVDCDSNVVVTVNVNEGYRLVGWSDGGTGNPRTFHLTGDTMVTAIIADPFFSAVTPSGQTLYYNIVDSNRVVVVNQNNTTGEPFYSNGGPAGALVIPDSVTHPNSGIIYVVDSIGDYAFAHCDRLISVSFPNTLRSIGYAAFDWSGLLSHVEFGNSLEYIGTFAFSGCSSIAGDLVFPESLRFIGNNAFLLNGNGVTSVTIQSSLITIGNGAFANCNNLSKIYLTDTFPPFIVFNTFEGCNANFYVPCQSLSKYDTALVWNNLSSRIYGKNYEWEPSYNFVVNDSLAGSVSYGEIDCDSNVVVTVNINEACQFMGWSDGNTDNPRTFHIIGDTTVVAIIYNPFFTTVAPSGQTLKYKINDSSSVEVAQYSCVDGALIIPNSVMHPNTGVVYTVNRIGNSAFGNCNSLTSVVIPNSVRSIGYGAFEQCGQLSTVVLGDSITSIDEWIFSGCNNLDSVYLGSILPPPFQWHSFNGCENVEFYVPCQYLSNYLSSSDWINIDYASRTYSNNYDNWEHSYNFVVNDNSLGSVSFTGVCDSNVVVTVNANEGYRLVGWSDGGSGNPRTFHLTGDTMVTAIIADPFFSAVTPSGQTLNYRIIENTYNVEIVSQNPSGNSDGGPSGDLIIHDSVVNPNTGITYVVVRTESYAFANCDNLISVVFPNSLTSVGYATFDFCDQISRVELGNSVTLIDDWSFSNCGNLSKIYLNSVNPPEIKDLTLESSNAIIYVPCQSVSKYQNATRWSNYLSRIYGKIENWEHSYNFIVNDSTLGSVTFTEVDCDSNVVVTVNVNEGYRLVGWSDGGSGNPRTFHLTGDTMVTAIIGTTYFSAVAPTGQTLNYMIDNAIYSNNVTLTGYVFEGRPIGELIIPDSVINPNTGISYNVITIAGQSFRACNSLTSVTIPNSVTTIGDGAFQECSNLTSLSIGNSVSEIQGYAFRDCGLISITIPDNVATIGDEVFFQCYNLNTVYLTGVIPPSINQQTFQPNVNYYVPCLSVNDYQSAYFWSNLSSHIYGKNYWKHSYNFIVNDSIFGSATFSEVDCDSNIVVTVNENVGYRLIGWSDGGTGNPRTFHLVGDTIVTAILDYIPYSVTVQPNDTLRGIVMGNDTVHYGDTVVIAATANYGYHFSRWNDGNTNNPRTLTITQDKSFTAIFDKNNYNIVLSADTNIHGHMTGMGDYEYLDNRTISAIANHGYHFTHWNDGDTNNPRVITLTQDTAFTAYFAKNIYVTIVESSDTVRGSAMGNATTEYLDTVVISATANYGYHFSQWNDTNTNNPRTIVVTNNNVYTAIFDKNNYNIALSADTNIHGYMTGMGDYEYLDNRTISAVPNYGYHFTHWNDGDTNNPRVITLTQDTAFTAYFANNTYTLTVLSNDSVLGEVSGSTVCEYLDTVSITATTIMPHYHFVQWSDGNTEAVRNVVVTCDSVVTAIFAIDTHSVVLAVNNDNYGTVTDGYNVPYGNTVTIEAFASEGYHFAEWSNGSRNNPETITVISDTMITAIFTDDVVPQICMVDVRDGYNTVLWEKGLEVMNYNIYREGDIAGSYEMVATVPYDSLSQWVDSVSRPTSRSYRYRMTATDIYGYESEPGDIHKTMHLTINKGIGNQWNLVWTEYEGTEYTTYIIYRGTNASNIEQIDVIPAGGNTTYTDENAQEGDVYYQVGVMVTSPCNPSKSSSVILSNIATNGNVGILDVDMTNIKVFSKDGKIIVHNTLGKSVQVFDMEGRTIFVANNTYSSNDGQVSISVPKSGVYLVKVGEYPARKVVVIK